MLEIWKKINKNKTFKSYLKFFSQLILRTTAQILTFNVGKLIDVSHLLFPIVKFEF